MNRNEVGVKTMTGIIQWTVFKVGIYGNVHHPEGHDLMVT